MAYRQEFMERAIGLAVENVRLAGGGPFGALVCKGDRVVATGVNRVTALADPTAHAEIVAIREACRLLGSFQLTGCDLYASCEPCPMCLGAIYWARPERVFYACTRFDAERAGFDDSSIYAELSLPPAGRRIPMIEEGRERGLSAFEAWNAATTKIRY